MSGWLGRLFRGSGGEAPPAAGARKWLPAIESDACTGCGCCVKACPADCLAMIWSFATLVRPGPCTGGGDCADACPEGLIRMDWQAAPGEDRAVGRWCGEPGE